MNGQSKSNNNNNNNGAPLVVKLTNVNSGDTRRIPCASLGSMQDLCTVSTALFGANLPARFVFTYTDEDNEIVTMSTDAELAEAQRQMTRSHVFRASIVALPSSCPSGYGLSAQNGKIGGLTGAGGVGANAS